MNQNPSGGTWGVMFIYEYPSWELLGETKGAIRTSGRVTLAERLGGQR